MQWADWYSYEQNCFPQSLTHRLLLNMTCDKQINYPTENIWALPKMTWQNTDILHQINLGQAWTNLWLPDKGSSQIECVSWHIRLSWHIRSQDRWKSWGKRWSSAGISRMLRRLNATLRLPDNSTNFASATAISNVMGYHWQMEPVQRDAIVCPACRRLRERILGPVSLTTFCPQFKFDENFALL